jgi:phosphoribosyl 1,2-cyclic phosphate phosphodiesterase
MKLSILGSGTSHGIPVLGCACPVCRSPDPRDRRMRASLYIEGSGGERVVIDTGPEFRLQALRAGITGLDAVLLTHAHADHVHGLDDVRPLSRERIIPVYGGPETLEELRERFSYVFRKTQMGGGKPRIELLGVQGPLQIGGLVLTPVPVKHGALDILGWKVEEAGAGTAVYLTDASAIPALSRTLIERPETLIIDGLRERPHETHFSFREALETAADLQARRVYLTHISHDHFHHEIEDYCHAFKEKRGLAGVTMEPAWDGLVIYL